jgi:hypothetical protein
MILEDCLGRITQPFNYCKLCKKDEDNLKCPGYTPHTQIELLEVDDTGLEGFVDSLDSSSSNAEHGGSFPPSNHPDTYSHLCHWLRTKQGQAYQRIYGGYD